MPHVSFPRRWKLVVWGSSVDTVAFHMLTSSFAAAQRFPCSVSDDMKTHAENLTQFWAPAYGVWAKWISITSSSHPLMVAFLSRKNAFVWCRCKPLSTSSFSPLLHGGGIFIRFLSLRLPAAQNRRAVELQPQQRCWLYMYLRPAALLYTYYLHHSLTKGKTKYAKWVKLVCARAVVLMHRTVDNNDHRYGRSAWAEARVTRPILLASVARVPPSSNSNCNDATTTA